MNELRACLSVSGAFLLAALLGTAPPVHAQADASRATPPPGKALVFVFRSDRDPAAVQVPVFVNLARVGDLANGTFVVATVNPGRTFLRFGDQAAPTYAVQAVANQSYFVRVEALPGAKPARTEVRMVNETDGRRSLAQSRLAGAAPPAIAAAARVPPPPAAAAPVPPSPAPAAAAPRVPPPPPAAAAPASAAAKPAATPAARETASSEASDSPRKFALIVSTGTFKMANADQTVAGLDSTFDTASSPVLSVEAEWRSRNGAAWGGEVFYYKNDLVTPSTGLSSQQQTVALMANGKYYFHAADWFYPFVGGGIGLAEATYSGSTFKGNAGGLALQGMAGMEFRFGSVGLHLQYKYLTATTGSSGKSVKVGGSGVLAGVSIAF
jgi:opacity protein-like surface antigen